ncbi:SIMPL domain-containing protein [Nocardia sp. NBC_00565]|uniref:SIMPL domain-containing protein n=1 Tax=Nocardia sp. NBC_00565 TaxID=2975993 RepID=UPI002E8153F9|nr:SIMPL domain-containing protein [Nocardia sp. NBC_00565]WUC01389.1 SIMPL domain-containing protein [Nocardia sp. NBC_00565]
MQPITRYSAAIIAVLGSALLITGCGKSDSAPEREVTVVGTGQVRGVPDTLKADLGVEVNADNVSTAIAGANEKAKAMTDAMVAAGLAREDVQTTDVSIQPQYSPDGHVISGYQATNTVHIVIRDLTKSSAILDAGTKAGGNSTRMRGVSFAIDDDSKLLADARSRAFADAKSRADQYAVLAGMKLADVITINEASSRDDSTPKVGAADSFQLEPGTQTVTFTVKVTWGLG